MNLIRITSPAFKGIVSLSVVSFCGCQNKIPAGLPNILWITSEDNSTFLGCYGDSFATTPNLDKLASEGFRFTHAYANAPVCAPARNTLLTGIYACSGGNEHMRSYFKKSDIVKPYPLYLREAGYYCTNNSKEDYNILPDQIKGIWDESSNRAHYKNRKPGQPFFAVFNLTVSHESSIHTPIPREQLRHDPEKVPIPPYHPRTEEMKHDWAQYYDKVEDMDKQAGNLLKELEDSGLVENTIVFYYADNGGVLGRSKRFVYESGTHVPFIVRIPEKYKYLYPAIKIDKAVDRLISFVDLAPTLLSITGIKIPEYMQGQAFLGRQKTPDPEYAFMFRGRMDERYDMSRAVRDQKFRYIRNYMPHRIYAQHIEYLWRAPSMQSWEREYQTGKCNEVQSRFWQTKPPEELYDLETDPWEINNLATDQSYFPVLERMRNACGEWVRGIMDIGFIPEAERWINFGDVAPYDYLRSGKISVNEIINAAESAMRVKAENIDRLMVCLKNPDSSVRYWGATGLLLLGDMARPAFNDLMAALNDVSPSVVAVAAEALYKQGVTSPARAALIQLLGHPNEFARCFAMNVVDCLGDESPEIQKAVIDIARQQQSGGRELYDLRAAKGLVEKWKIDPSKYGLRFNW